ncbi:PiggyBac transposable element-derived protein like [Argiope bruennichi]|uniref:PiggyBac transposable element-derived protein like n=1 Tax=Argiope bruennichi TaxID=94029 RepID=A0A8T0FCF6_ARGBR|nr:PiggyBac transposable element-derived protein like [Argiope bruennichi]
MSKRKQYFKDHKEMVDYLMKIFNEDSDSEDIEDDLQFPEYDADLSDENLEQENPSGDSEIDGDSGKPEVILDYNMTKGGVDTCDKMCAAYSVSRITRRWPLVLFYIMMNIAGINSHILFLLNNVDDEPSGRIIFLRAFSKSLMKEHLIPRAQISSLPRDVTTFLDIYRSNENLEEETSNQIIPPQKRVSCYMCE